MHDELDPEQGRIPADAYVPCRGKTDLFVPTEEQKQPGNYRAESATARRLCAECQYRRPCAVQGTVLRDTASIRAGLRTWIPEEKKQLVRIALGKPVHPKGRVPT